jgi:hypothetical protein
VSRGGGGWRATRDPISAQDRADHWRGLAAEVLNAASGAKDPQIRAVLLTIAALYEDLALRAELTNLSPGTVAQPVRWTMPDG